MNRLKDMQYYTTLPNEIVNDPKISFKAKGMLLIAFSNADHWKTSSEWFERKGPDGRESVRSGMKELEEQGYVTIEVKRGDDGLPERTVFWNMRPVQAEQRTNLTKWKQPSAVSAPQVSRVPESTRHHKDHSLNQDQRNKEQKKDQLVLSNDPPAQKPFTQFIQQWCEAYQSHWGMKYVVQPADTKTLKTFLEAAERPIAELTPIAKAAWERGREDRQAFNCRRASDIKGFCLAFNAIQTELLLAIRVPGVVEIPDRD